MLKIVARVFGLTHDVRIEPDAALMHPLFDALLQPGERAADDKEDMSGVDNLFFHLPAPLEFHGRPHLRGDIMAGTQVYLCLLH